MKVAVIGTGKQFIKRVSALNFKEDRLVGISYFTKHNYNLKRFDTATIYKNWKKCIDESKADTIIICTPPYLHKKIVSYALNKRKHVLCEKPMTQSAKDAKYLFILAKKKKRILKCGFNHRHHPGIILAKKIIQKKSFGNILFSRCVYGICGRKNYLREWRANPKFSAGGNFIEHGIHLIDLLRWFIGDPITISLASSNIINKKRKLDQDVMAILKFKNKSIASLHTSLNQWENRFLIEIYGEFQYIEVSGISASYGNQKVKLGSKKSTGPFEYKYFDFRTSDNSWANEWQHFKNVINGKEKLIGDAYDAYKL